MSTTLVPPTRAEIAEQLGWQLPTAVVSPMAGGSLLTKLRTVFTLSLIHI